MPKVICELNDNYMAMSRSLHMEIAKNVAKLINLPPTTEVRYAGNALSILMPGSTLDDVGSTKNRLPGDQRIYIEVTEEYDENFASSATVRKLDQLDVFSDKELHVYLHPVYQRIKATMSIKLVGTDYTTVSSWIATCKRMLSQDNGMHLHDIDYHYHIPLPLIEGLLEIHKLRENNQPLNENAGLWFKRCFIGRMDIIANQAGLRNVFVIRERQTEIMGQFDFVANPPKSESENSAGAWSATVEYQYSFDRVESMVLRYPPTIHNQMMSPNYLNQTKIFQPSDIISFASMSVNSLRKLNYRHKKLEPWADTPGIPIPPFDDWFPHASTYPIKSVNVFRILVQLDKQNPTDLINLTQLGSWELPDEVIAYLKETRLQMLTPGESLFYLSLYEDYTLLDPRTLIVSPTLSISSSVALNERKFYHLCLNMLIDLSRLSDASLQMLTKHPDLTNVILSNLDPTLPEAYYSKGVYYKHDRAIARISPQLLRLDSFSSKANAVNGTRTNNAASQNLGIHYSEKGIVGEIPDDPRKNNTSTSLLNAQANPTMERYPILPQIYDDGELHIDDIKLAIDYIRVNRINERVISTSAHNWRLIGSLIVHTGSK